MGMLEGFILGIKNANISVWVTGMGYAALLLISRYVSHRGIGLEYFLLSIAFSVIAAAAVYRAERLVLDILLVFYIITGTVGAAYLILLYEDKASND
jgi:hypothetical protein